MQASTAIGARSLRLERGRRRLIDLPALDLAPGGITLVMGHNGAGKSLLLRLLHGLIAPDSGTVLCNGRPVDDQTRARQAMVFQKPMLLRRSVAGNLGFVLRRQRLSRADRSARLVHWLARAGLADKAGQPARSLSGGEAQRLAMVRALATEPDVLFLDEPTASLDPAATLEIEALVRDAADRATKIVMVTHDIGQARRLGGELVFLHRGACVEQGAAMACLSTPASAELAAFLAGHLIP